MMLFNFMYYIISFLIVKYCSANPGIFFDADFPDSIFRSEPVFQDTFLPYSLKISWFFNWKCGIEGYNSI